MFSQKKMSVKAGEQYRFTIDLSDFSGSGNLSLAFACFDKKGRLILPCHFNGRKGSDTVLAAACDFTDEKLIVKDASNWRKHAGAVVAFETKKDRSDLPNRNISRPGISGVKKRADGTWEISLENEIGKRVSRWNRDPDAPARSHL